MERLIFVCCQKRTFGLDLILPSTKFMQCQVTIRNSLKQSPNADIREMHNDTSNGMNLQFDNFNSTKEVLKSIRKDKTKNVTENLKSQGVLLKFLLENTPKNFTLIWACSHYNLTNFDELDNPTVIIQILWHLTNVGRFAFAFGSFCK